jgi:diguanylate cyclase (GGDEF)-like protein
VGPGQGASDDPEQTAAAALERIRRSLETSPLPIPGEDNHQEIALTVSVGASFALPREALGDVLNRADQALYTAKESGRNQVVFS